MGRIALAWTLTWVLTWAHTSAGPAAAQGNCSFAEGFASLQVQVPDVVGQCLENEQHNPESGDAVQRTTNGLLVWRKADNHTAFTNGNQTWINGPNGLVNRPNDTRFSWESNSQGLPVRENTNTPAGDGALLPGHRVVAYYGNPRSAAMGVLGQLPPDQMLDRLDQQAQAYAQQDPDTPVRPALELVAVAAQRAPGADGLYRGRSSPAEIEQVIGWARSRDYLTILDVQPGRSTFAAEVEPLLPYLAQPDVHLALDPEWAMEPGQVPGQSIGGTSAATVNQIAQTLAEVVESNKLPPKLLIVHRFLDRMVRNAGEIAQDPRVQVTIVMDGVGGPAGKISRYNQLVHSQEAQYAGFKVFYTEDTNPLSPEQVLGLTPPPQVVIYQ